MYCINIVYHTSTCELSTQLFIFPIYDESAITDKDVLTSKHFYSTYNSKHFSTWKPVKWQATWMFQLSETLTTTVIISANTSSASTKQYWKATCWSPARRAADVLLLPIFSWQTLSCHIFSFSIFNLIHLNSLSSSLLCNSIFSTRQRNKLCYGNTNISKWFLRLHCTCKMHKDLVNNYSNVQHYWHQLKLIFLKQNEFSHWTGCKRQWHVDCKQFCGLML